MAPACSDRAAVLSADPVIPCAASQRAAATGCLPAWPAQTAHRQVSRLISSRRKIVRLTAAVMGCWQTEHKLKIVHHGLGASNQPHDSGSPVLIEQGHARNAHSYQLDHLVE